MSHPQHLKRFRMNPIEMAIFSITSIIFAHSVYNLVYNNTGFSSTTLTPMSSNPISEGRNLASMSQPLMTVSLPCEDATPQTIQANKLRLSGNLCGFSKKDEDSAITEAKIINKANQFQAEVFTDIQQGRFSTEYIPLNPGQNDIAIRFTYKDLKSEPKIFEQIFTVQH